MPPPTSTTKHKCEVIVNGKTLTFQPLCFCISVCHIRVVLNVAPLGWYELGDIGLVLDPIHVNLLADISCSDRWILAKEDWRLNRLELLAKVQQQ